MESPGTWARMLAGAGLVLLVAGGLLAWRTSSLHQEALNAVQVELDERTRERDRLAKELADERQRRHALEQVWSAKLNRAQSQKTVADRKLLECEGRGGENSKAGTGV